MSSPAINSYAGSLRFYRIMAFTTGVVLVLGVVGIIVKAFGYHDHDTQIGWLWVAHGWLYVVYLLATVNLGVKLRWPLIWMGLVALAGTVPTMSFVAEHFVTADARKRLVAEPAAV